MLILTRRVGEVVRIGDDIEVVVVEVRGTEVRMGIKAPRNVTVLREEVATRTRHEQAPMGE